MYKHDNEEEDAKSDDCTLASVPEEWLVAPPPGVPTSVFHPPTKNFDTDASDNDANKKDKGASDNDVSGNDVINSDAIENYTSGNDTIVCNDVIDRDAIDNDTTCNDGIHSDTSDNNASGNDMIHSDASDDDASDREAIHNDAQTVLAFWRAGSASQGSWRCRGSSTPLPRPSTSISSEHRRVQSSGRNFASATDPSVRPADGSPGRQFHTTSIANMLASLPLNESYDDALRQMPEHSTGIQQSASDGTTTVRAEPAQSSELHVHSPSKRRGLTYDTMQAACKHTALRLASKLAVGRKSVMPKDGVGDSDDADEDTCSQPARIPPSESGTYAQDTLISEEADRRVIAVRDTASSCTWRRMAKRFGELNALQYLGQYDPKNRTLDRTQRNILRIKLALAVSAQHLFDGDTFITKLDTWVFLNGDPGAPIYQLNHQKIIAAYLAEKKRQPRVWRHPTIPDERCSSVRRSKYDDIGAGVSIGNGGEGERLTCISHT